MLIDMNRFERAEFSSAGAQSARESQQPLQPQWKGPVPSAECRAPAVGIPNLTLCSAVAKVTGMANPTPSTNYSLEFYLLLGGESEQIGAMDTDIPPLAVHAGDRMPAGLFPIQHHDVEAESFLVVAYVVHSIFEVGKFRHRVAYYLNLPAPAGTV